MINQRLTLIMLYAAILINNPIVCSEQSELDPLIERVEHPGKQVNQPCAVEATEKKQMPLPMFITLGAAGTVAGWYTTKWSLRLSGRLMKNPFIAATAGTLVISPVLKKTLCAEQPEVNPFRLFMIIHNEWTADFKRAAERIKKAKEEWEYQTEAARKEYEQKYPALYALFKDWYKRSTIDERIEEGKKALEELKEWKKEQQQKLTEAFKSPRR